MRTICRRLAALFALALALRLLAPFGLVHADVTPPPVTRNVLGAAPGNGVNVVTDYAADPTGAANNDTAFQNAINAACNNVASPFFQTKEIYVPAGLYKFSATATLSITNGCHIYGPNSLGGGNNAGAAVLRRANSATAGDFFQFRGWGVLKLNDLRLDLTGGNDSGGASYARVQAGGAGYAVNDTITLTGGTFTTATVLKVTAISAGAVTGVVITTPGSYSVAPSSVAAVAQGSTSGSGTAATFNVVYANSAAISLSGPTTTLTADAASGATALTVASIANFANGDQIQVEQDDGTYKATTISGAPSGNTITLAAGLTFKASANHPVYDTYGSGPIIADVTCANFWDCIRVENSGHVTVRNLWAQDFGHDGVIKTSGAKPDNGVDRYQVLTWDANRGSSNAGVEFLAGGDVAVSEKSKTIGAKYGVLLNSYFGPTGTLLIEDNSLEEPTACTVRLHQSVSGTEYANVIVTGNEFSNIVGGITAQDFCIDTGTPNTAPKWVRNVNFSNNVSNGAVTASVSMVNIQDGDNVIVVNNNLGNNSTSGATAIAIGGSATNVTEAGNTIVGFPTGSYGTILNSSLVPVLAKGGYSYKTVDAAIRTAMTMDTTQANGIQVMRASAGGTVFTDLYSNDGTNWHWSFKKSDGTNILDLRDDKLVTFGGAIAGFKAYQVTKTGNYTLLAADSGTNFDNTGAAGEVDFTLPAYAAGLRYCFQVTAAQTLKVIAPASSKIAIGATNSAAAGNVTANTVYATACILATSVSNQWAADRSTGSWTVN